MHLFAVIAITAAAPFVSTFEPGADGTPAPATAPAIAPPPTPPAPPVAPAAVDAKVVAAAIKQPAAAPTKPNAGSTSNGALSNLVAEAIKRKLEKAGTNKAGVVELPGSAPSSAPSADQPQLTGSMSGMPAGFPGTAPDPAMVPGEAKVMMGAPADGSPSYVRTAPPKAGETRAQAGAAANANPLAASTDPMESGTSAAPAAAEPGTNHNLLDIFVGTWDVSANFDNGPGQPPETASGQMVNSWQLEGRWLKQDYSGQMTSLGSFHGLGYLGYDNLAKTYVATWMDTLSTSCLMSKGQFDEAQATFTLSGDFTAPGGEKFKQKQVITVLSPDRYTVTMYLTGPDGVEFKTGNLEYTRSVRVITGVSVK